MLLSKSSYESTNSTKLRSADLTPRVGLPDDSVVSPKSVCNSALTSELSGMVLANLLLAGTEHIIELREERFHSGSVPCIMVGKSLVAEWVSPVSDEASSRSQVMGSGRNGLDPGWGCNHQGSPLFYLSYPHLPKVPVPLALNQVFKNISQ